MIKFYIENKLFEKEISFSDINTIQSYNKKYNIKYINKELEEILLNIYNKNDFIIIDITIYNYNKYYIDTCFDFNNIFLFDANEQNKNMDSVLILIDKLNDLKFTKQNKLIVIGGGITQDMSGFSAAIYKRGINWTLIPTTLLCMTDSAIGGKVCLNRKNKNILSLFNSPNEIYISDIFIKTLKEDDIISGIGEALKLSLIGGNDTYNMFLEKYEKQKYLEIIKLSSNIKQCIIEYDELEKYERKILNYGHTFGHALESVSSYFIPHGIAVLYGICIINFLFYENKYEKINDYILNIIPNKFKNLEISYERLIENILNDKKNDGNKVCFILMEEIGKLKIVYYNLIENNLEEKIKKTLKYYNFKLIND